MNNYNVGSKVGFQFGSDYLIGTISKMITPARAEIIVPADNNKAYEVDTKDLFDESKN